MGNATVGLGDDPKPLPGHPVGGAHPEAVPFTYKIALSRSRAEGVRTPDLRRAKVELRGYGSGTGNAVKCRRVADLSLIERFSGPATGGDDTYRH